jgi:Flp pilus assembly pilin Flp
MKLTAFFLRYGLNTRGATAIEYGLIAAGIALAIAASVFAFGDQIYDLLYEDLPGALEQ